MAYEHGTVNGHLELMTALKTFLTANAALVAAGQNWTALKDQTISSYTHAAIYTPTGGWGAQFRELYLRGPGLAGTDEIHVQIRAFDCPYYGAYNWGLLGSVGYDNAALFEGQPDTSSGAVASYPMRVLPLTASTIEYWFVANGRRFIVVAKISGDFYALHGGFLLPYATPAEYPYPMFLGSCHNQAQQLPSATDNNNFWVPQNNGVNALVRSPGGAWAKGSGSTTLSADMLLWPYNVKVSSPYQMIGHADGLLPLIPFTFYTTGAIIGEIEGVYFVPGLTISGAAPLSEDTITVGADTYLVVQNCDKTDRNAFAAIKLA